VFFVNSKGPRQSQVPENITPGIDVQAITVVIQPASAPAEPKQTSVARVGMLPGLLTVARGSSIPAVFPMIEEKKYFALWYMEKFVVRTTVTLPSGAKKPVIDV
jgi:hypothetical protein